VTRVNSQHKAGVNAAGTIGGDLFTTGAGTNYAENIAVAISDTNEIAAAGRLYIIPSASNTSAINTSLTYGHNDSWDGNVEAEFTINFTSATDYTITQGGSSTNYTGFDQAIGISYGDVKINFDSAPSSGHSFTVSPNTTGLGDNNNITEIYNISSETIFSGKTLREYYINEVGKVATYNDLSKMSTEAKQVVLDSAMTAKDRVSGVNLDEEAAELVRLQQAYLASARAMQVSNKIFEELMRVAF
jgi:flagellar hook-associated protein 1 FlgK